MHRTDSCENGQIKVKVKAKKAKENLKKYLLLQMFEPESLVMFSWI